MSTPSAPFTPGSITADNLNDAVNKNVASATVVADSAARDGVQNLGLVHQARTARLTRVAAAVAAHFGAGSGQAAAAQAAVKKSQATVVRVAAQRQQVTVPAPKVTATGWALYGHVYDAQLKPATAYTVFLVDQQNAYQSAYGFSYTDKNGSYVIDFAGPTVATGAAPPPVPPPVPLFIQIVNANAQPVYLSPTAFQPRIGTATYQDITLPPGEPVIGDPPAALRAIAFPNITKS